MDRAKHRPRFPKQNSSFYERLLNLTEEYGLSSSYPLEINPQSDKNTNRNIFPVPLLCQRRNANSLMN
ncbi:hypothetical protein HZS_2856 [Henneguya salminicola]|nr:hypothetical protein HZS_2856 [Henneguya salminicola]